MKIVFTMSIYILIIFLLVSPMINFDFKHRNLILLILFIVLMFMKIDALKNK